MYIAYYKERKNFKLKKIIKVFFCILTCLIISIPQIYAEESKTTKELSETIEKPAEVTSNENTELPKTESTIETEEKPDEEPEKEPSICYTTHIQDIGWQNQVKVGGMAGTEGQAKRLEAIKITLKDLKDVYSVFAEFDEVEESPDDETKEVTENESE